MDFKDIVPEEPVDPQDMGDEEEYEMAEVFGVPVFPLNPLATPTGVVVIARLTYEGHDVPALSYRSSDNLAAWEIAAMLREYLAYVELCLIEARED